MSSQHSEQSREPAGRQPAAEGSPEQGPPGRPNLSGDLDEMFLDGPAFRLRWPGYDRLQVDNYVGWAEAARQAARQETDDLLQRYGRCWAELEAARRELVHSPEGQQMAHVTERISAMLQLAADEAAEITATAKATAERLRSAAEADADAERQRTREVAAARQQAERGTAELTNRSAEERARLDEEAAATRARLDAEAAQVRDRLDREAAECRDRNAAVAAASIRQQFEAAREKWEAAEAAARERLARVEEEVAELEHRREAARVALLRMSDQVSGAVTALSEALPAAGLRLTQTPPADTDNGSVTARRHLRPRGRTPAS